MLIGPEDACLNDFVKIHGLRRLQNFLNNFVLEYVRDNVKLPRRTENPLHVLERGRNSALLPFERVLGYCPYHFTYTDCENHFCVLIQVFHESIRRKNDCIEYGAILVCHQTAY